MTSQPDQRQQAAGKRPVTRRLAAGAATAMVAALAMPSLPAAGAAAVVSRAGRPAAAATGGTLRAWGENPRGQLGDGTTVSSNVPVKVKLPPGTRITSVRAGCLHTLALTNTGQVLAWGANDDGQLGNGTTTPSSIPVKVKLPAGTKITAVRAGCGHSLALTSTGKVLAWGLNDDGQLGNGTTGGSSDTPTPVTLPKVKAISAGFAHNLALTSTGKVLAWGLNDAGQLGDGATGGSTGTPVTVMLPAGARVTAIAVGDSHSLARTSNGKVLAWGDNFDGQLGNGSTGGSSNTPVRTRLPKGTKVRGLVAGCSHTLALTTTGKVLAWGDNGFGQLGDGGTDDTSDIPVGVELPQGTKVTAISAGCEHSLARTAKGNVLAWGFNVGGQLGDGTTSGSSSTPVRVKLPAGLAAIAIGAGPDANHSLAIVRKAKP